MKLALNSFITRQISHVSEEGWPALRKKMKRLALLSLDIPIIILASPIVIIIRLLRPFLIIRIGKDDIGRIGGPYSSNLYLSEKSHGRHGGRIFDWFYFVKSINDVNQQWEKMWKRELPIFPWAKLAQSIELVNQWFPDHKQHQIQNNAQKDHDRSGYSFVTRRHGIIPYASLILTTSFQFEAGLNLIAFNCR